MNAFQKVVVLFVVGAGVALTACATPGDEDAPIALTDAIDPQDEGTSYDGWSQNVEAYFDSCGSLYGIRSTLARSYGDASRSGGACFVVPTGASCSSDATCDTSAKATYGISAHGYCYSGSCYSRPGSQGTYCTLAQNRGPGTLNRNDLPPLSFTGAALGCMTKTSGVNNFACMGDDTSLYMRYVSSGVFWYWC